MSYLLGPQHVRDVEIQQVIGRTLATLQSVAASTQHPQLIRIVWRSSVSPEVVVGDLVGFHRWLPSNTPHDSCYVLHFSPTPAQQGQLHNRLEGSDQMAAAWTGNQLQLIGAASQFERQLFRRIAEVPFQTAEDLARNDTGHSVSYVKQTATKLGLSRCVSRNKTIPQLPEVVGRNRWHYVPLWVPVAGDQPVKSDDLYQTTAPLEPGAARTPH